METEFQKSFSPLYLLKSGLSMLVHILVAMLVIYTVIRCCSAAFSFSYEIFGPVVVEEAPGQDKTFSVQQGEKMWQVAERLEEQGMIVNRYTFYIRTRLLDSGQQVLCAGEYVLNTSMGYEDIINTLTYDSYN